MSELYAKGMGSDCLRHHPKLYSFFGPSSDPYGFLDMGAETWFWPFMPPFMSVSNKALCMGKIRPIAII